MAAALCLALLSALLTPVTAVAAPNADKMSASLRQTFAAQERHDFWVSFDTRADTSKARDIARWAERGAYVVDHLKQAATEAQADTVRALTAAGVDFKSYWVTNAIRVEGGDYGLAQALAAKPDVRSVFAPVAYTRPEPVKQKITSSRLDAVPTAEWGVRNIKADEVWQQYGVRGDGIVVASIDSGAQFDHPALVNSYRGYDPEKGTFDNDYNWFDVSGGSSFPADSVGHGTHTMGTMVGDDGGANQVGVAPGAKWIAANGCCPSDQALVDSAQWMLAPTKVDGSAPDPAKRPNVINNSWGTRDPSNDPFIEDITNAWADAGIFGVFSNGNNGPGCNTSGAPGSRTANYSVGAYDSGNKIADFSSRGAGQDGEVKPNISAPGVDVRSSLPGNQYGLLDGTSMATPHVAGAVALLWSAKPELIGDVDATRKLLDDTATDTPDGQCGGTDDDNNVYGEGRLDALALVKAGNPGATGTITGTVTDAETGAPVPSARIRLVDGDLVRSARTGTDGTYTTNVATGDYQATVTAFAFKPTTVPITVTAGQTTTTDIRLTAADGFTVSGKVVDQQTGNGIPDASVTLAGTRFAAVTKADGTFTVPKVPGPARYQLTADTGACARTAHRSIMVDGDVTLPPVEMTRKLDTPRSTKWGVPYGYTCVAEPTNWIGGTTPVKLPPKGSFELIPFDLPFAFTYFGEQYRRLAVGPSFAEATFQPELGQDSALLRVFPQPFQRNDEDEAILTRTAGTAPNRTFTVEWRDFFLAVPPGQVSTFKVTAAMTLHENGDIVFAYKDLDPESPRERGLDAAVSIHDHSPDGRAVSRTFLDVTKGSPILSDTKQIRFGLPPNGVVAGRVLDNTGKPVPGAAVDLRNSSGTRLVQQTTDGNGAYRLQLMTGRTYSVAVSKAPGYETPAPVDVTLTKDRQVLPLTTTLHGGGMALSTSGVTVRPGATGTVTLTNSGDRSLSWRATTHAAAPVTAPGSMLASATTRLAPTGIAAADGRWWVAGVPGFGRNALVELEDGHPTGAEVNLSAVAAALGITVADFDIRNMAVVPGRGWLCMFASFNLPETIVCVDPETSEVMAKVSTGFGPGVQLVGMDYDPARDVFFVGASDGGFRTTVKTVAGLDHPEPGAVQRTCVLPFQAGGLGYNATSGTVWSLLKLITGMVIRQFDPESCGVGSQFAVGYRLPGFPFFGDLDARGNVLLLHSGNADRPDILPSAISTMQTSDPRDQEFPWLHVSATSGTLKPHGKQKIQVSVDWDAVPAGVTGVRLVLRGNGGANTTVTVPITLQR